MTWELRVRLPGRWLTLDQAREYLNVPESLIDRYVNLGLIQRRGTGSGLRLNAEHVCAVGILLVALELVLSEETQAPAQPVKRKTRGNSAETGQNEAN